MKIKLAFGLGGALLLALSVLTALAWTPMETVDAAVSDNPEER